MFDEPSSAALYRTVAAAIDCYRDLPKFQRIQLNGMRRDVGSRVSAQRYIELYRKIK